MALPVAVLTFVDDAAGLSAEAMNRVRIDTLGTWKSGGRDAATKLRLSASVFSQLDKIVRDALRPSARYTAVQPGLAPVAHSATMQASQALLVPHLLTPTEYRLLTDPFKDEGIHIPDHPQETAT